MKYQEKFGIMSGLKLKNGLKRKELDCIVDTRKS